MNLDHLISCITPEIYANLKEAIELGRWKDGRELTSEQRESCMTAVIAYEAKHVEPHQRTGFIDRGKKKQGEVCADGDSSKNNNGDDDTQIIHLQ